MNSGRVLTGWEMAAIFLGVAVVFVIAWCLAKEGERRINRAEEDEFERMKASVRDRENGDQTQN